MKANQGKNSAPIPEVLIFFTLPENNIFLILLAHAFLLF